MKLYAFRTGLILVALSAASAAAVAAVASINASYAMPGVDANGNPWLSLTGVGGGKVYKDSTTGILVAAFTGVVPNTSGAAAAFTNQGLSLTDPWTQIDVTATVDYEYVAVPVHNLSPASLTMVCVPSRRR